jgi:hypothetical protein
MPIQTACGDGRPSKYNAQRVQVDGRWFASKAEARGYQVLKILEAAGKITNLKLQPRYVLQAGFRDGDGKWVRSVTYVADFEFMRDGKRVAVDVKGVQTPAFRIKAKLFATRYPEIALEIWR